MNRSNLLWLAFGVFLSTTSAYSQDNLIHSIKDNASANSKAAFQFTEGINLENTPVRDQGSTGTCWSYSGNSFLESEMIRMGKAPVQISPIYTARQTYIEKAKNYVRLHGDQAQGEGGQVHDVLTIFKKYGAVPYEAYTGLQPEQKRNNFSEMTPKLHHIMDTVAASKKPHTGWLNVYTNVLDQYLGKAPETFSYQGKNYTPRTFADEVIGIHPADYVAISSFEDYPYYQSFVLLIPDNWSFESFHNVQINDLTAIVDDALSKGFTLAWATDVSEKSFSWKNGVAYVPEKPFEKMTEAEKNDMFNGPKTEPTITPQARQAAFDDYSTTDDHGMHIVGTATDQNGKEYYTIKNSWGESNDYKGYMYVTKEYVRYKTISLLLHKDGLAKDMTKKLGI